MPPTSGRPTRSWAANAGLSRSEIEAIASDHPVTGIDPEHILLCSATDELSCVGTLTDARAPAARHYGDELSRKYVTTIAWFNMVSLFFNGCRVALETTDKIGDRTSTLE